MRFIHPLPVIIKQCEDDFFYNIFHWPFNFVNVLTDDDTLEAEHELVRKRRKFGSEGPPCGSK